MKHVNDADKPRLVPDRGNEFIGKLLLANALEPPMRREDPLRQALYVSNQLSAGTTSRFWRIVAKSETASWLSAKQIRSVPL